LPWYEFALPFSPDSFISPSAREQQKPSASPTGCGSDFHPGTPCFLSFASAPILR
jgi:hypothetical protein